MRNIQGRDCYFALHQHCLWALSFTYKQWIFKAVAKLWILELVHCVGWHPGFVQFIHFFILGHGKMVLPISNDTCEWKTVMFVLTFSTNYRTVLKKLRLSIPPFTTILIEYEYCTITEGWLSYSLILDERQVDTATIYCERNCRQRDRVLVQVPVPLRFICEDTKRIIV